MAKPVQRRLAAIAVADVVGYSRLMGSDEVGTLQALSERRKRILTPVITRHGGRLVKVMGDGVLVEFGSAVNAVLAALELQEKMEAANVDLADDKRIVLRIGINLGEVIVEGADLFGDGVNIAARLESIAPVGGIAISASAYEQVRNRVDAPITELGLRTLKNIAEPVMVYRVGTQGVAQSPAANAANPAPTPHPNTAPIRLSIAILPFTHLGGDDSQRWLSDGLTEDIITELSRWRMLSVRSRSASDRYRDPAVDPSQVARELDVRFLLEGSVRPMGPRLRISVALIDTETGRHIWSEKYDRASDDIFELQDEVVRTIVSTLVGRVQASDVERSRRKPPANLAAYEYVLRGNAQSWDEPEGLAEARRLFERAVEIDPDYGFAHAMISAIAASEWKHATDAAANAALLDRALASAQRAVALDENESTCFSILAQAHLLRGNHDLALEFMRRAARLNPNNQWNVADMGFLLVYCGEPEEAIDWFRKAREIDPFFDASWYWRYLGLAHLLLGQYAQALAAFARPSTRTVGDVAMSAGAQARLGDFVQARLACDACLAMRPDFSITGFMAKQPFRRADHSSALAEALRLAGLPGEPEPGWVADVLKYWFDQVGQERWFAKDAAVDDETSRRFLSLHQRLLASGDASQPTPRAQLAAIIVLDQFSRNMFRGTPRALAADGRALAMTKVALARGDDGLMSKHERLFLYMPLQHSENREDQTQAVALTDTLGDTDLLEFANAHQALVERFGRFPHRNAIIGRESTPEEAEYLREHPQGF